ncbi:MAG TPA: bacteriohopanetetrol glucosamine biosynthesis glycosyltransferase HpnI [Candidatus Baltobacteraceae bacterium]
MPASLLKAASWTLGAGTLAGIAYTAFAIARVRAFRKNRTIGRAQTMPPITVLKPLYGNEPHLFENLSSFCDQDYPQYQLIFGAVDPRDPALGVARAVKDRFPHCDIEVVAGNGKPAANPKVGNLLGLIDRARHPIVVIADSDIRVGPDYLRAVAGCFADPHTGAATCAYGGIAGGTFASRLGAMYVNDQFTPSVMVASALEPLTYCFGATIALRADVLARIGGLHAVADRLADDYLLGKLASAAGYRVALVPCAVQTTVADETLAALWRHELRWARAVLGQRAAGYAGSIVTYVLPFAVAFAAVARSPLSYAALSVGVALRVWLHLEGRATFAPQNSATPWFIPLRDFFSVAVWTASFFGKRVLWKSDAYHVSAGGRMAVGPKEM